MDGWMLVHTNKTCFASLKLPLIQNVQTHTHRVEADNPHVQIVSASFV